VSVMGLWHNKGQRNSGKHHATPSNQWEYCWKRRFLCALHGYWCHPAIGELLEAVFPAGSALRLYNEDPRLTESVELWDRLQPVRMWSREHRSWEIYDVGSHYQTTRKDTAHWKGLVCAVVNCKMCELVKRL
jgi:hypothetical protein